MRIDEGDVGQSVCDSGGRARSGAGDRPSSVVWALVRAAGRRPSELGNLWVAGSWTCPISLPTGVSRRSEGRDTAQLRLRENIIFIYVEATTSRVGAAISRHPVDSDLTSSGRTAAPALSAK